MSPSTLISGILRPAGIIRPVIILIMVFGFAPMHAQTKSGYINLETTDITKDKSFNSKDAEVFGLHLGMSIKSAFQKIRERSNQLRWVADPTNIRRFYLENSTLPDSVHEVIALLIWPKYDTALIEIDLYPAAAPFLAAGNRVLLSADVDDPKSSLYKNFLGAPSSKSTLLYVPSIGLINVRYYYSKPRLMIEKQTNNHISTYNLLIYNLE